jgi:hypothetical protein
MNFLALSLASASWLFTPLLTWTELRRDLISSFLQVIFWSCFVIYTYDELHHFVELLDTQKILFVFLLNTDRVELKVPLDLGKFDFIQQYKLFEVA